MKMSRRAVITLASLVAVTASVTRYGNAVVPPGCENNPTEFCFAGEGICNEDNAAAWCNYGAFAAGCTWNLIFAACSNVDCFPDDGVLCYH